MSAIPKCSSPDVSPASLNTTTFDELAEEIGDLAKSEEDVLMYALFPNEARTFLSKHRATEKVEFLLENESSLTKEDDYVDINQIRELLKVVEESRASARSFRRRRRHAHHMSACLVPVRRGRCSRCCGSCMAAAAPVAARRCGSCRRTPPLPRIRPIGYA